MTRLAAIALALAIVLPGLLTLAPAAITPPAQRPQIVGTADRPVHLGSMTIVATSMPALPSRSKADH